MRMNWLNKLLHWRQKPASSPVAVDDQLIHLLGLGQTAAALLGPDQLRRYGIGHDEIYSAVTSLPAEAATVDGWLLAFRHLTVLGYFRCAGACRARAVEVALKAGRSSTAEQPELERAFMAAVDQGQAACAEALLAQLTDFPGFGRLRAQRFGAFAALCAGDLAVFRDYYSVVPDEIERAFRSDVVGREVAIVGPSSSGQINGAEIDSFEWVVRNNPMGDTFPDDHILKHGQRVDIGAYNFGVMKRLTASGNRAAMLRAVDGLKWLVIKAPEFQPKLKSQASIVRVVLRRWEELFFHGHANLAPSNVFTFLAHGASRVKLFNSNFYLARAGTPYDGDYLKREVDFAQIRNSFASHDLISQRNFFKSLLRGNLIEVDEEAARVLTMSEGEYLEKLDRLYGAA